MQLARRIANGHAHQRQDPDAVKLAASSKDLTTERHADNAKTYHAKYGSMYDSRSQERKLLPKVLLTWLQAVKTQPNQQPTAPQVRRYTAALAPCVRHHTRQLCSVPCES
jgi:hypothetical protein